MHSTRLLCTVPGCYSRHMDFTGTEVCHCHSGMLKQHTCIYITKLSKLPPVCITKLGKLPPVCIIWNTNHVVYPPCIPCSSGAFGAGVEDVGWTGEEGLVASVIPGIILASAAAWKSGETRFWMKESWMAGSFSGWLRSMKMVP